MRTDIEVRRNHALWDVRPVTERGREVIAQAKSLRIDDYLALLDKAQELDARATEI